MHNVVIVTLLPSCYFTTSSGCYLGIVYGTWLTSVIWTYILLYCWLVVVIWWYYFYCCMSQTARSIVDWWRNRWQKILSGSPTPAGNVVLLEKKWGRVCFVERLVGEAKIQQQKASNLLGEELSFCFGGVVQARSEKVRLVAASSWLESLTFGSFFRWDTSLLSFCFGKVQWNPWKVSSFFSGKFPIR